MNEKLKRFFKKLNVLFDSADGKVWSESEIKISQQEVGGKVELINADGTLSPAADGEYEMEDGFKFTVKDGQITAIDGQEAPAESETKEKDAPVEAAEETKTDAPAEETPADDKPNEVADLKAFVETLAGTVADLAAQVESLKGSTEVAATKQDVAEFNKEVTELHETIKKLAKVPVEFSKTNMNNRVRDDYDEKVKNLQSMFKGK